jgi:hypothetical protein
MSLLQALGRRVKGFVFRFGKGGYKEGRGLKSVAKSKT